MCGSNQRAVVVTGGGGFIGRRVVGYLVGRNAKCRILIHAKRGGRNARTPALQDGILNGVDFFFGDLTKPQSLGDICAGIDTVIHLAGYAHAEDADSPEAAARHRHVTVEGTHTLLTEAVQAGVRRFVFVSSVKAMGEGAKNCLDESAAVRPVGAYGRAKLEAEKLVLEASQHGMHVCILRLPLVYGPGGKGNIPRMIAAVDKGYFPPLPRINNRRSMIHVEDVVQALWLAAENPVAGGKIYIATDGHDYSTREIYVAICRALGRPVPSWTVPAWLLRLGGRFGDVLESATRHHMPVNTPMLDKLLGSACYSSERIRRELGFVPRHTFFDALQGMIEEHRAATRVAGPASG